MWYVLVTWIVIVQYCIHNLHVLLHLVVIRSKATGLYTEAYNTFWSCADQIFDGIVMLVLQPSTRSSH